MRFGLQEILINSIIANVGRDFKDEYYLCRDKQYGFYHALVKFKIIYAKI